MQLQESFRVSAENIFVLRNTKRISKIVAFNDDQLHRLYTSFVRFFVFFCSIVFALRNEFDCS